MLRSMTGYGSAKGLVSGLRVTVELRSVNNRFLDVSVRLPRSLMFAEEAVKKAVGAHITRGKVDVFVTVEQGESDDVAVTVNEPLLRGYIAATQAVHEKYGLRDDRTLMSLLRMPDVLSVEKRELDRDAAASELVAVLDEALAEYDAMRRREGERLGADVSARIDAIGELTGVVERDAPGTVAAYRERLRQKLCEVLGSAGIDESRILTEAAVFADRIAVDEETVRLRSHLSQLGAMLAGGSPVGRRMDFLIQELNREANTIGSKCQNSEIAYVVVDLKSEIEKIREQIQNVE